MGYKIKSYISKLAIIIFLIYFVTFVLFVSVNKWNNNVTKHTLNKYFPHENKLKSYLLNSNNLHNISYPCIIKPIICSGTSRSVSLLKNTNDLYEYLKNIDPHEKYIIQEFYKAKNEIGVLYEKIPFVNDGNIVSVVIKKNDSDKWKPLKCGNIKNNETTGCTDLTEMLKKSHFSQIIKDISSKIPNFNAGRYDIGFDSFEELNNGQFKIFELNGVMGYDLRANIGGADMLSELPLKIYYILRWQIVRYLIGLINILSFKISPFYILNKFPFTISNAIHCSDCEHLYQASPA
jgi:hypothetical protein